MYRRYGKRVLDFVLILGASPLLLLAFVITAIWVRLSLGTPILFRQPRAGLQGRIFTLMKFRSMSDARDAEGRLLSDEVRLTRTGKLLRASSLDELPQLWNVLRGEMSLIGPRPLLVEYLPRYNPTQARRHEVRPGISGWAQVNGRNAISWEQKFEYDVYYVDHVSCLLDFKIVWLTLVKVLRRRDVNSAHHATMERFQGTPTAEGDSS